MTTPQIIVLLTILLAMAGVTRLYAKLCAERAKRIGATVLLVEARRERDEWAETAHSQVGLIRLAVIKHAKQRHEITKQAEQIDALLNGDRRCVDGHRYYTGQGISCPHCQANEVVILCAYCGQRATRFENSRPECEACNEEIPF